jgi:hypothetical protein
MKYYFSHWGIDIPKILNDNLNNWIQKYLHFNGLKFFYMKESAYNYEDNVIYIGTDEQPIHTDFRQFLYEYGCKEDLTTCHNSTLTFLHELGHTLTDSNYNDLEQLVFKFQKEDIYNSFDYWHIHDEFEANMFVVNFINNNPEAVKELDNIFAGR